MPFVTCALYIENDWKLTACAILWVSDYEQEPFHWVPGTVIGPMIMIDDDSHTISVQMGGSEREAFLVDSPSSVDNQWVIVVLSSCRGLQGVKKL